MKTTLPWFETSAQETSELNCAIRQFIDEGWLDEMWWLFMKLNQYGQSHMNELLTFLSVDYTKEIYELPSLPDFLIRRIAEGNQDAILTAANICSEPEGSRKFSTEYVQSVLSDFESQLGQRLGLSEPQMHFVYVISSSQHAAHSESLVMSIYRLCKKQMFLRNSSKTMSDVFASLTNCDDQCLVNHLQHDSNTLNEMISILDVNQLIFPCLPLEFCKMCNKIMCSTITSREFASLVVGWAEGALHVQHIDVRKHLFVLFGNLYYDHKFVRESTNLLKRLYDLSAFPVSHNLLVEAHASIFALSRNSGPREDTSWIYQLDFLSKIQNNKEDQRVYHKVVMTLKRLLST